MYVPPVFKVAPDVARAFVRDRGFGLMIAVDGALPVAVHAPFLVNETPDGHLRLEAHVARANPFHEVIARAPDVLIAVSGPDAYISPDWYVAKDQVPTWNYIAVHLRGRARPLPADRTLAHVDALSTAFEQRLAPKPAWHSAKMPEQKRSAMLAAIVAFEIDITGFDAQWKLGQHKSRADRIEVARMLAWRGAWDGSALAEFMKAKLREG
jgi:transcriptional regulator